MALNCASSVSAARLLRTLLPGDLDLAGDFGGLAGETPAGRHGSPSSRAFAAFCRAREAHAALSKRGGLTSLVHLARSPNPELQRHVATAFFVLSEHQAPKTWLVQSGCVPFLFAFIRNGDAEVRFLAAKAVLYLR